LKLPQFSLRTLLAAMLGGALASAAYWAWPKANVEPKSAAIIFCACWYFAWSLTIVSFAFDQDAHARPKVVFFGLLVVSISALGAVPLFMLGHTPPGRGFP
jgi:hypothetical protein